MPSEVSFKKLQLTLGWQSYVGSHIDCEQSLSSLFLFLKTPRSSGVFKMVSESRRDCWPGGLQIVSSTRSLFKPYPEWAFLEHSQPGGGGGQILPPPPHTPYFFLLLMQNKLKFAQLLIRISSTFLRSNFVGICYDVIVTFIEFLFQVISVTRNRRRNLHVKPIKLTLFC